MQLLLINCYSSQKSFDEQFRNNIVKPEVSIQKYFKFFLSGLIKAGAEITTISERQISYEDKGLFYRGYEEKDDYGQRIIYAPLVTVPVLYQLFLVLHTLIYVPFYFIKYGKPDYVICDIMRFYSSFPTLMVGKLFGVKVIGYVADIPQMYHHQTSDKQPLYKRVLKRLYSVTSIYYNGYILLSEYMNEHVNKHGKPYIIVEGLVDDTVPDDEEHLEKSNNIVSYLYAGGLFEKYGVKMLVDAFLQTSQDNLELWLFGKGELEEYIKAQKDNRIKFFGYQENDFVVSKQREASFLINTRPSDEEYTKFSFPSKIMEYMASGTPVISTRIKSIPEDYWKYIIPILDETEDGIKRLLEVSSNMTDEERISLGRKSREFVLENKDGLTQGKRVLQWLKESYNLGK